MEHNQSIEVYEFSSDSDVDIYDKEFDEIPDCLHQSTTYVNGSTICNACNMKLEDDFFDTEARYYGASDTRYPKDPSRHHHRKNEERSLKVDLNVLGFPQEIIDRADTYYQKIIENKIYRAKNRLSIVFACVFNAYKAMGEPRAPDELARVFNLNKKGISKGLKTYEQTFRNSDDKKYITALDLIPKILSKLNLHNNLYFEDIKIIYNSVQSQSTLYKSSNPQSVAAGLVYLYLKLAQRDIPRVEYNKIVNLTDITYTRVARETANVLNLKITKI